jgi:hypothetical protein
MSRGSKFYARKAGRRDANHATIRDGLRALGHFVVDTAGVGGGVLDLCVWPRGYSDIMGWYEPKPIWLEVKTETGQLRTSQLEFIAQLDRFGIGHAVARTLDEAIRVITC